MCQKKQTITLLDENKESGEWDKFVQFPPELRSFFPGSYISPELFLETLGVEKGQEAARRKIMSMEVGERGPVFSYEKGGECFGVQIMNGLANEHALTMSRLAQKVGDKTKYKEGFASDNAGAIRAEYQSAMAENIKYELTRAHNNKPAIRIHDDCLASGDSIISYLYDRTQDEGDLKKMQAQGVDVVIDGPATAQGILYLQAFAKAFGIKVNLTAGHMAFGLTAGDEKGHHTNYITYPPHSDAAFYRDLGESERNEIKSFGDMGAVVGDMGEAEQGIEVGKMTEIRKTRGQQYCLWNSFRTDNHGKHPYSDVGISIEQKQGEHVIDYVYFARGGYLPYALDLLRILDKPEFADAANIIILRVSRLNVTGGEVMALGYGAGIKKADCVTYTQAV